MSEQDTQPTKRAARTKQQRRRRRDDDLGVGNGKLYVPEDAKDPNYHYRWVNDNLARPTAFNARDDYDFVSDDMLQDGAMADANENEGTRVSRVVGYGPDNQPMKAYLMAKPMEFHEEDQAKKQKKVDARDEAVRRGKPTTQSEQERVTTYIPEEGIDYKP